MESALAPSSAEFPRSLGLHVAWLSARPIGRAVHHPLPALSKALLEIEVDGVHIFVTHLASRHEEGTHPRDREVQAILEVLGRCDAPHLLAGDLNALASGDSTGEPPPGVVPRLGTRRDFLDPFRAAGYVDCYRAVHDEPGYTYSADSPWLRLDYVFASPALAPQLRSAGVVATPVAARASDHLPVWAEFR
jgi:endonuclease/exonuclease/phosphatase family metal-dependent hydrolase